MVVAVEVFILKATEVVIAIFSLAVCTLRAFLCIVCGKLVRQKEINHSVELNVT